MSANLRELIGGAIAILAVGTLGIIGIIQAVNHLPFDSPPALAAVAGASVAVYLSNAGNTTTAEKMTNGFLTATTTAAAAAVAPRPREIRATDIENTPVAPGPVSVPPSLAPGPPV